MPELTHGSRRCQCGQCGRFFSTPRNFDLHQTIDPKKGATDGKILCFDPAARGLIERDDVWQKPAGDYDPAGRMG